MATVTPNIIAHESPNCGARRDGAVPSLVVLHYTAMDNVDEVLARLCDADAEVSAHYLITRTGVIYQLVAESARAWHAGVGQWGAINDVNSHSIGVELMNSGAPDYPEYPAVQMRALAGYCTVFWRGGGLRQRVLLGIPIWPWGVRATLGWRLIGRGWRGRDCRFGLLVMRVWRWIGRGLWRTLGRLDIAL